MKMEETFFAKRFAMFRDRFGTSWMLPHARRSRGEQTDERCRLASHSENR
jgi:hypothetical protein